MREVKIAVFVSGNGSNLQCLIDAQSSGSLNGKIEMVLSSSKDACALKRAKESGIESCFIESSETSTERILQLLKENEIELIVLAGYMKILESKVIKRYENRIINIHPSLMPSFSGRGFYGKKVHKAALEYGVKITGATTHFVNEGVDKGPIIMQAAVNISDRDSIDSLSEKVLEKEHEILLETVRLYCLDKLKLSGRKVRILD